MNGLSFKEKAAIISAGIDKYIWVRDDNKREYNFLPNGQLNISNPAETVKYELAFDENEKTNTLKIGDRKYGLEYNNIKDSPIIYLMDELNRITFQVSK